MDGASDRLEVVSEDQALAASQRLEPLLPRIHDPYLHVVSQLAMAERYYASATRYTASSFMRLKLSGHLSDRGLARTSMKAAEKP